MKSGVLAIRQTYVQSMLSFFNDLPQLPIYYFPQPAMIKYLVVYLN